MQLNDLSALVKLHNAVFKKGLDKNYFRAKYFSAKNNYDTLATIAFVDQVAVGFFGAIQQEFTNGKTTLKCAHTCESITLPKFQRMGIHTNLANLCFENMKDLTYQVLYAFYSENTFRAYQKLNWVNAGKMVYTIFYTSSFPSQKVLNKIGLIGISKRKFKSIFSSYFIPKDKHLNPHEKEDLYCNHYANNIQDYRTFTHNQLIEIRGVKFWLKADYILHIGYIDFKTQQQLLDSIKLLIKLAKKAGYDKILYHCDQKSKAFEALNTSYQFSNSWTIGFKSLNNDFVPEQFGFNYADFDTF